jgi:dTDP-4-dehydrorhamnose reductase
VDGIVLRVVIIGVDGAIGAALAPTLRANGHSVTGTTRRQANIEPPRTLFLDLATETPILVPDVDVVVICAAMARFEDCRKHPVTARHVNVEQPLEIARQTLSNGGRVLLLSTSAVFDCLSPHRRADEPCAPRSAYGRLKAEAETKVLALGKGASVLRLTKVVRPDTGILADWIETLKAGRSVAAFDDHAFCPLPLAAVIAALVAVVESKEDGMFQVSGAQDISYAEAASHLAARLHLPRGRVSTAHAASGGITAEETTPFTSLDTARLTAMNGFVPPAACDVLDAVYGPALASARAAMAAHS